MWRWEGGCGWPGGRARSRSGRTAGGRTRIRRWVTGGTCLDATSTERDGAPPPCTTATANDKIVGEGVAVQPRLGGARRAA